MYFITKKTSETGKNFQKIAEKMDVIFNANKKLSEEIGFEQWRGGYWSAFGGFSSLIFKEKPDEKVFKKVNGNEWLPKLSNKLGKEIQARLDASPKISIEELNQCIGFNGAPFKTIGFARNNKEYFGFVVQEEWKVEIPQDCEEVTVSSYNKLFRKENLDK